tara:strand:+ start:501 stop:1040 length:540 start_codon:yes stop_codon:yes gene_type:complete
MNLNELILKARADMDEKNAYCQKHFNCDYSECTPAQKRECNQKCGVPKQVTDSSPNAVNILDMDEDGKKKVAKSDEKTYKNMNCMNCSDGTDADGNACENCYPKKSFDLAFHTGWTIAKAQPCSVRGCGAMPGDGPENCNAGEKPSLCSRRKAAARQDTKQMRRQKGKVKHLDMADEGY